MVRVSVLSKLGRELAGRYGVRSVPTFLVLDSEGTMMGKQVGLPKPDEIEVLIGNG